MSARSCWKTACSICRKEAANEHTGREAVSARRIGILQQFGAEVWVVAPEKRADFAADWRQKAFTADDLTGVFLAVAAADDRQVNHAVAQACAARGILVSVADCAAESTFYFPAICEGGGLTAGLVSDGTAHRAVAQMAKRMRRLMEEST